MLDPRVEDVLHVVAARVDDDRAVAERARAELHPALEPADDVALGDPLGDGGEELVVVEPLGSKPAARIAASHSASSYSGPVYACSITKPRSLPSSWFQTWYAAPTAIPESPAAGWT